jgi:hypothetical protein
MAEPATCIKLISCFLNVEATRSTKRLLACNRLHGVVSQATELYILPLFLESQRVKYKPIESYFKHKVYGLITYGANFMPERIVSTMNSYWIKVRFQTYGLQGPEISLNVMEDSNLGRPNLTAVKSVQYFWMYRLSWLPHHEFISCSSTQYMQKYLKSSATFLYFKLGTKNSVQIQNIGHMQPCNI